MRVGRISLVFLGLVSVIVLNGCVSSVEHGDLKAKNRTQQERLDELDSELGAANLRIEQLSEALMAAQSRGGAEAGSLREEIAALEADIAKKKSLIFSLQKHLLGGVPLPVELSTQLQDFADGTEMVTFDSSRGVVKFKSDLLFERGSDTASSGAVSAIKSLCRIMNSQAGKSFDIIIAGHTDDMPIKRAETRRLHPTNWHLSVHRAISVERLMETNGVSPKRLSVRGFGEYRPAEKNKPKKGGNPKNRRVEIFIVPTGM